MPTVRQQRWWKYEEDDNDAYGNEEVSGDTYSYRVKKLPGAQGRSLSDGDDYLGVSTKQGVILDVVTLLNYCLTDTQINDNHFI